MATEPKKTGDEDKRIARRMLLKLGIWVTPAIIATFTLNRPTFAATCTPQTRCTPSPCTPSVKQCNPVTK